MNNNKQKQIKHQMDVVVPAVKPPPFWTKRQTYLLLVLLSVFIAFIVAGCLVAFVTEKPISRSASIKPVSLEILPPIPDHLIQILYDEFQVPLILGEGTHTERGRTVNTTVGESIKLIHLLKKENVNYSVNVS